MSGDSAEGHGSGNQTRLGVVYVPWYGGTWRRAGRPVRCVVMARRQLDRPTDDLLCISDCDAVGWLVDGRRDGHAELGTQFIVRHKVCRKTKRRTPSAERNTTQQNCCTQKPLRYSVLLLVYARYAHEAEDSSKHDRLTISFNKCHSVLLCSVNRL